jgi:hypothetical protein
MNKEKAKNSAKSKFSHILFNKKLSGKQIFHGSLNGFFTAQNRFPSKRFDFSYIQKHDFNIASPASAATTPQSKSNQHV